MPLIRDESIEQTRIALWQIDESNDWFIEKLNLSDVEKQSLLSMKPHRQKEWLSSRWVLHVLSGSKNRIQITKDEHGKPFLKSTNLQISLSHSKDKVAAIISDRNVGIDVEKIDEKIFKIAHKFISPKEELHFDKTKDLNACHIFWGSKESMYKAYGKRKLDFKKDMHLYPFKIFKDNIELKGTVCKKEIIQEYGIYAEKLHDFYLIYSILEHETILPFDTHTS